MKYFWILILLFCFSCGEKKTKTTSEDEMKSEEVKDTAVTKENILPEETNSDSVAFAKTVIDAKLPFEKKVEKFIEKYKLMYSEVEQNKTIVPERYTSKFSKKIGLKKKTTVKYDKIEGVYPIAQLWFYEYEDSTACRNVLNNWLQCYGFDCTPVEFMVDLPAIKTTPSFLIYNEKEIIFLQYQCEHVGNNWKDFKDDLQNTFAQYGSYYTLSLSDCGKKLVWKNYWKINPKTLIINND